MMIRKSLTLAGLMVACAGIGLFIAIGIYVWSLKSEVNRQTETLARKAHDAGNEADRAIDFVRKVIAQAQADLADARKLAASKARPARPMSMFELAMARTASQRLAGSVDRAHGAVVTASDAVVVAEAALQVFNESTELKDLLGVQPSQMAATKSTIDKARSELRQAQTALGGDPTPEQLNAVDSALVQGEDFTNETAQVVETVRRRVDATKTTVDWWSLWIAVSTSVLCTLASVGQLFMARYCWRTLRGQPA
jgi:hydrogenase maturation protease